ncbi:MAG: hypothetical protein EX263_09450 [Flavobacteriaceae bacterium]|nr:MAG: hypothetical protein EX263_09450 [Flavobacteriaceae bacterium]
MLKHRHTTMVLKNFVFIVLGFWLVTNYNIMYANIVPEKA